MPMDVHTLFQMTQAQLDELFTKSKAGPIPDGPATGTAIIAPGPSSRPRSPPQSTCSPGKGKNFDAKHGVLRNRISVLGLNAIVAEVYKGPSWLDQKECIVLDYSKTSTGGPVDPRRDPADRAGDVPREGVRGQEAVDRLRASVPIDANQSGGRQG